MTIESNLNTKVNFFLAKQRRQFIQAEGKLEESLSVDTEFVYPLKSKIKLDFWYYEEMKAIWNSARQIGT